MGFIYVLLGLTLIIFVHELGHFLAARWAGVKVITFSIGIGPRLITLYKDKQGAEFIISWIPLGGYVRMKGQEDLPLKETYEKKLANDHYLAKSTGQRMVITLAGVFMNFVLAYFLIILAYNIGVPFLSNKIGSIVPNSPAAYSGLEVGDEVVKVNDVATESFEDVVSEVALSSKSSPLALTVVRGQEEKTIVIKEEGSENLNPDSPVRQVGITPYLVPSVGILSKGSSLYENGLRVGNEIKEITLAKVDLTKTTLAGMVEMIRNNPGETVNMVFLDNQNNIKTITGVTIGEVEKKEKGFYFTPEIRVIENFPAEKAGIKDGDVIVAINNEEVRGWEEVITALNGNPSAPSASEQDKFLVDGDLTIPIKVVRDGEELDLSVMPIYDPSSERYFIGITPLEENNSREVSVISERMEKMVPGIRVGDRILTLGKNGDLNEVVLLRDGNEISFAYSDETLALQKEGYLFDFKDRGKIIQYDLLTAFSQGIPLAYKELKTTLTFLKRLFYREVPLELIGGPIAIVETSYIIQETKGWAYFILLFAKISISIAVLNLLPVPPLDGGSAVIITYEMIRKKPVPEGVLKNMYLLGFFLLVFLMIYVNYNDIVRLMNR